MKLKNNIVTQDIMDEQFLIALDDSFQGMVRSNPEAAFIIGLLKKETNRDEIVKAMHEEYDADLATIEADVDNVLNMLRSINAIEE